MNPSTRVYFTCWKYSGNEHVDGVNEDEFLGRLHIVGFFTPTCMRNIIVGVLCSEAHLLTPGGFNQNV